MARTGVTYEEVELQADTLIAKGENPTLEKIRRALGDRGSNTTLSKYLNEWRGRRAHAMPVNQHALHLSDPLHAAVKKIWQQVRDEAELEITRIREEAKNSIAEMDIKEKQTEEQIKELKEQIKAQDLKLQDAQEDIKILTEKLANSEKMASALESSLLETKHWSEVNRQERESLEGTLRRERETIGRLEERLIQFEIHLRNMVNS